MIVRSFCTKLFIKLRYLGLTLLGVRAHLCHSSYENPGFFDHQYLRKKLSDVLVFLHRDIIITKGKYYLRLPLLVWYSQLCFSSNQIAGLFDHQYICKESIDTFALPFSVFFLIYSLAPFIKLRREVHI